MCIRSFLNWPASTPSPWCSHALSLLTFPELCLCGYACEVSSITHRPSSLGPSRRTCTGICTPSPHFYWSQRFLCEQDARASPRRVPESIWREPNRRKDPASHTRTSPCWSRRCPCESLCLASPCKSMQIPLSSPSELPPTDFTCWERSLAPCK